MKYQTWLQEWLNNYVRLSAKKRTIERYEQIITRHIVPNLGEYEMDSLTMLTLQKYIMLLSLTGNLKTGKGLSPNSVNSIVNVIQGSIRAAYNSSIVSKCISDKLIRPRSREKPVECFSLQEQNKIVCEVLSRGPSHLIGIVICLYTGLRIGELLALTWNDIDFDKGLLSVTKSCYDGKNEFGIYGRIIDTPKTSSSVRTIPLPKQLTMILRQYKKPASSAFVISVNGKGVSLRSYQRHFSRLLEKLGIAHHGFHALRHTFATRALECGMDVKTLSELLGHKNATVTLNRYAHSMLEYKRNMMNTLGKSLILL